MPQTEIKFIQTSIDNQKILSRAKTLENFGYLHSHDNNYYYLKISDKYIIDLFELIEDKDFYKIPDYFTCELPTGAHISIVYSGENPIIHENNLGQKYYFDVIGLSHIQLNDDEFYVLTVSSPSLTKLRSKYQLPIALSYKSIKIGFHITIAKKI